MEVKVQGRVGLATANDGVEDNLRLDRTTAQVVSQGRGRYSEAGSRGLIFAGMTPVAGTTVVAANNSPVAAAAATVLSLYNPMGSGIDLEVLKAWLNHISGTPAAGAWVYNVAYAQSITAVQNNAAVGAAPVGANNGVAGVGQIFAQTGLTGGVGAQRLYRPFGSSQFAAAIAATTPGQAVYDLVDGEIVLPPGGLLSIASPGTGTTHVVAAGFCWQETRRAS